MTWIAACRASLAAKGARKDSEVASFRHCEEGVRMREKVTQCCVK